MRSLEIFGLALFSGIAGSVFFAIGSLAASATAIATLLFALGATRMLYLNYRRNAEAPPRELTAPEQLHRMVRMALTGNRLLDGALADDLHVSYPTFMRWSLGLNLPYPPIAEALVATLWGEERTQKSRNPESRHDDRYLTRIFFMEDEEMRWVAISPRTGRRLWKYRTDIGFQTQALIDRIRVEQPWITEETILAFLEARGY